MHLDLTLTPQSVAGTTASRSYAMLTTDPTTVVIILAADSVVGGGGLTNGVQITQLTAQNPRVQVNDSSTFVYFVVTQGLAVPPQLRVWMDAIDGGGAAATAWTVIGPVSSASPASPGQLVLVSTSGVTITLPSAVGIAGQRVAVKDTTGAASPNITVAASNAQSVNGASSVSISTSYGSVTVVSDGANWWTIA